MTEREWLTTETKPAQMIAVRGLTVGRKSRLAACGLCRLIDPIIPPEPFGRLLARAERDEDTRAEMKAARWAYNANPGPTAEATAAGAVFGVAAADRGAGAVGVVWQWVELAAEQAAPPRGTTAARKATRAAACAVLREVYGNPFRPRKLIATWLGGGWACPDGTLFTVPTAVRDLANQIAAAHGFADLPVLADALDDAGCPDAELVAHLRHGTGHRPGCWALDLVRGVA